MAAALPNRHVAVMVDTDDSWGQRVVDAVVRFAQQEKWSLLISPRDNHGRWKLPRNWQGDGVITLLRDAYVKRHLLATKLPVVNLSVLEEDHPRWGSVMTDDQVRARLAMEHFLAQGFKHFACFSPPSHRYPRNRGFIFKKELAKAGYESLVFTHGDLRPSTTTDYASVVIAWLSKLPRPLAVFAPDPYSARTLVEICQWNGIEIPAEVAIVAGDTDDLLCCSAKPTISSIELSCQQLAIEGCKLLGRLMQGMSAPKTPIRVPPLRVTPRQSTDTYAIDDPEIKKVLRYIEQYATTGISVKDIVRKFPISRRRLEVRFVELLGKTPAEEIRRRRLDHARRLLTETNLSIEEVAIASGISSGAELASAFKRHLHIKPSDLRGDKRH